jgi:general secretion pathway protein J
MTLRAACPATRGFTLIEVLVALAIFAIMSGIAFRGLGAVIDARERITEENRQWREIAMALSMIERDLAVAANRPGRSREDLIVPPFAGNATELGRDIAPLQFSRMGEGNAPIRRVGYRLQGTTLQLLAWPSIDAAPGDEAVVFPLLDGVQGFTTRFLDASGNWLPRWPAAGEVPGARRGDPLPRAVEVRLSLAGHGELVRVFALP